MAQFLHRYMQYRRVGFSRISALHFAWMVSGASIRPIPVRLPGRT